jgi:hypothetical protein
MGGSASSRSVASSSSKALCKCGLSPEKTRLFVESGMDNFFDPTPLDLEASREALRRLQEIKTSIPELPEYFANYSYQLGIEKRTDILTKRIADFEAAEIEARQLAAAITASQASPDESFPVASAPDPPVGAGEAVAASHARRGTVAELWQPTDTNVHPFGVPTDEGRVTPDSDQPGAGPVVE